MSHEVHRKNSASVTPRMTLFKSSSNILLRPQRPLTRFNRVERLAFQQPVLLLRNLQAVSITSVAFVTTERNPRVSAKVRFPSLYQPTANQKLGYLSFYFQGDDTRICKAYIFTAPKRKGLIVALTNYALEVVRNVSDEYSDAFQKYVEKLRTGEISLQISKRRPTDARDYTAREPKALVPRFPPAGKARYEEIGLRLRQGQSFLDIELSLRKTLRSIAREANRILGEDEVKKPVKINKQGQWSDVEIQRLIMLREQRMPLTEIAKWLRRTKKGVAKRIQELKIAVEGPQALPPGLQESLFNIRLTKIWQALLKSDMTHRWEEALQEKSAEQWLSKISMGITEDTKKVLGGLQPPTWEELERLPLVNTNEAVVYARLVTSRHYTEIPSSRYLYVGSASKYGGGLNSRIAEHTRRTKRKNESRLQRDIRTKRLKGNGSFVTLMVMKMESSDEEVVLDVRRTVTLAEAILTVWLGALQSPTHTLQRDCPWDPQTLQYTGWSSHNPLVFNVALPGNSNT